MRTENRQTRRQLLHWDAIGPDALPLTGSASAPRLTPSDPPATLRLYSPRFEDSLTTRALSGSIEVFQLTHPSVKLIAESEAVPGQEPYTLSRQAAAGQLPDLIAHVYLPTLVHLDAARDLTGVVRSPGGRALWDDLAPEFQRMAIVGDRVYGLPAEVDTLSALFYNKVIFTSAGLEPLAASARWDDFVVAARRTTLGPTQKGFALIANPALPSTYARWLSWYLTAGGSQFTPDRSRVALDQGSAGVATLNLYIALAVRDQVTLTNSTTLDDPRVGTAFARSEVAMIQDGSRRLAWLRTMHPGFVESVGVTALPGRRRDAASVQTETVAIGSQSMEPELAWEFLQSMLGEANAVQLFQTAGGVPASTAARRAAHKVADPLQRFFLDRVSGPAVFDPNDERYPAIVRRGAQLVHDVICGCIDPAVALRRAVSDMHQVDQSEASLIRAAARDYAATG